MHKLVYLTVAGTAFAQQVANLVVSNVQADSFDISWDSLDNWDDLYQVSVLQFASSNIEQQVTVFENF